MNKTNYTKKVLCLNSWHENEDEIWTAGLVYDATKHKDGSWSIETNQSKEGRVGSSYMPDNFDEHFSDVSKGVNLLDAVRIAYNKGYFVITDADRYGCLGVHCETPSTGFYFGGMEADEAESAEEYVKNVGIGKACQAIAWALEDMATEVEFVDEAVLYLTEMKAVCTADGKCAVEEVIDKWIQKAEKTVKKYEQADKEKE